MVYTCGLDSVGAREGFPSHGTLHGRAAKITRAECSNRGIFVEGEISDTALFGKNLLLKRRIYSDIGSDTVTLKDTLVNLGFREEDYCLLYHVNVGYPMLDEGAEIRAEIEEAIPRTAWAKERAAPKEYHYRARARRGGDLLFFAAERALRFSGKQENSKAFQPRVFWRYASRIRAVEEHGERRLRARTRTVHDEIGRRFSLLENRSERRNILSPPFERNAARLNLRCF